MIKLTHLLESFCKPVVVGYISTTTGVKSVLSDKSHVHNFGVYDHSRWRYNPYNKILYFIGGEEDYDHQTIEDVKSHIRRKYNMEVKSVKYYYMNSTDDFEKSHGYCNEINHLSEASNNLKWCAVVLSPESQIRLKELFYKLIPPTWNVKCHHMTIDPFNGLPDSNLMNSEIKLRITAFGRSDKAYAIKVDTKPFIKTNNAFPHITLAVNPNGGTAKDSNFITSWTKFTPNITFTGYVENLYD